MVEPTTMLRDEFEVKENFPFGINGSADTLMFEIIVKKPLSHNRSFMAQGFYGAAGDEDSEKSGRGII
ncbi:CLUMA_CG000619, isoform A [Clunio marinus]|uniref:CLUMA_CG000619, isoform A n=1 Tax=Clunio marinus TaxID=568069 RepID=A0A1J1HH94_9DIPT|nr:CLUMA_CG000619, isoform A [Clunio marinus]